MTVEYSTDWGFFPVLFRWKGSLWRLIYFRLILFLGLFTGMTFFYRLVLNDKEQARFREAGAYFDKATTRIPITFLVGFYVNFMVGRWWEQWNSIAWPDRAMVYITSTIRGTTEELRMIRRTMARWINLMAVLTWREISSRIRKRFPEKGTMLEAELVTQAEFTTLENENCAWGYWVPCVWICNLAGELKEKGIIDSVQLDRIINEVLALRGQCGSAMGYNWLNIPIVYTQVATVATYGFFLFRLLANQPSDSFHWFDIRNSNSTKGSKEEELMDLYFPIMTVLEFCFYMGWLGVAEQLFNPWGEDDEDFELNYILDRNIKTGYVLADHCHQQIGTVGKDRNWDSYKKKTPHTILSWKIRENAPKGMFHNAIFKKPDMALVDPDEAIVEPRKWSTRGLFNRAKKEPLMKVEQHSSECFGDPEIEKGKINEGFSSGEP